MEVEINKITRRGKKGIIGETLVEMEGNLIVSRAFLAPINNSDVLLKKISPRTVMAI